MIASKPLHKQVWFWPMIALLINFVLFGIIIIVASACFVFVVSWGDMTQKFGWLGHVQEVMMVFGLVVSSIFGLFLIQDSRDVVREFLKATSQS